MSLAFLCFQIELLSQKQNGSAGAVDSSGADNNSGGGGGGGKSSSIRGMWKKAFKSLKSKDKAKTKESKLQQEVDVPSGEKGAVEEKKYSRLVGDIIIHNSLVRLCLICI